MSFEPIRSGVAGFVGKSGNVGSCLLFNFVYYPAYKAFKTTPLIRDIHEHLGVHRVVSNHHMPEAAISRFVADRFPDLSIRLYVNVEGVDQVNIGPNVKAHYRSLNCPLMFLAKTIAEASPSQYPTLKNRKNHIWKVAESALEENLKSCTSETVVRESDRIRVVGVEFDNDIALPPSFFPKPR